MDCEGSVIFLNQNDIESEKNWAHQKHLKPYNWAESKCASYIQTFG